MFVLLAARLDLGRQAAGNVIHQRIEFIEDGGDASLLFKGRNWYFVPKNCLFIASRHLSSLSILHAVCEKLLGSQKVIEKSWFDVIARFIS